MEIDSEIIDSRQLAEILQVSDKRCALLIAKRENLPSRRVGLVHLFNKAEAEALAKKRGGRVGPGRPRKQVNQ